MPTIHVSDHVKDELDTIKQAQQHTSYDSLVRELLIAYESHYPDHSDGSRNDYPANYPDDSPEARDERPEE